MVKELTTTAKVKDNDLNSGDKFMLNYITVYKYEMPYKGQIVITQCWPMARSHNSMVW